MIFSVKQDQQERWRSGIEQWKRVTDGLGQTIDPGILETVVVLNLLLVQTSGSCEGHAQRGCAYPWVDIEVPLEAREDQERLYDALNERFMSLCVLGSNGFPVKISEEAGQILHERDAVGYEIRRAHHKMVGLLLTYLDAFYQKHSSSFDRHLTFSEIGLFGMMRLHSVGGLLQTTRPESLRQLKLLEYQQEMHAFTEFLKAQFFQGASMPDREP